MNAVDDLPRIRTGDRLRLPRPLLARVEALVRDLLRPGHELVEFIVDGTDVGVQVVYRDRAPGGALSYVRCIVPRAYDPELADDLDEAMVDEPARETAGRERAFLEPVLRGEPVRWHGGTIWTTPPRRHAPTALRFRARARRGRSRRRRVASSPRRARAPGRLADDPDLAPVPRVLARAA
jgi:hypothetical protein